MQLPYLSYNEGTTRKGSTMTEFTQDTTSKNNSTRLLLIQYPDVSDVILNINTPQKDFGVLVLGSDLLTYKESLCNKAYLGALLDSRMWC